MGRVPEKKKLIFSILKIKLSKFNYKNYLNNYILTKNMKKIILPGLIAGVIILAVGMIINQLFSFIFPSLMAEYASGGLFRAWTEPLMSLYFVYPFFLGIVLSLVWDKTKNLIKEKTVWRKGFVFGMVYWLVAIPGMIITYSSFKISLLMVVTWTIGILAQAIGAGVVLGKLNR